MSEANHIPYHAVREVAKGKALVLAPHADDEVLGCGGAIIRHAQHGDAVVVVIATDGGYADDIEDKAAYIAQRRKESLAAAAILGYGKPVFWDYPDRGLICNEALIAKVKTAIEQANPVVVYAPSLHEMHPDHCHLALATVKALQRLRQNIILAFYEVGVPLHPNLLLDITDIIERKTKAIDVFQSQLARSDYKNQILGLNRFRSYTLGLGVKAAEAYHCVALADLWHLPEPRCFDRTNTVSPKNDLFKKRLALLRKPGQLSEKIWQKGKTWILKKRLRSF